jgi:hypothetical protein
MVHFQKDRLPPALALYEAELGKLGRPNRKGWCACRCPFHDSKSGKSFAAHVDGAFYCHGCRVKGSDLVAFLRLRYGLSFKGACLQLGVWDEDGPQIPASIVPVSYLTWDFDIDGIRYRESVKNEPRNYADKIRRFYREASDRLIELRRGDVERYTGEGENCWAQMVCAVDEWRGNLYE